MSKINLAIIYYSSTGTNYRLATLAEEAAKETNAEVRVVRVEESAPKSAIESNPEWKSHYEETKSIPVATTDDLVWAEAIIFSVPTRFGNIASQMQQFLDTTGGLWFEGKLINKVVSAMSSSDSPHGGQEATILSLYTTMYHWGAIVVAPGYSDDVIFEAGGNPYGTSVTTEHGISEKVAGATKHQVKRVVTVANWMKNGRDKE
ncbi:NAD(P)H dehydrogenase (quinone) [Gracilibacillus orientalis]|uniref:NAD(P)H dehydrogenase (Quinone) n=1 Tax=Gracilibacillus orientalis TaxID=334253 RepID=A0A1I4NFF2_9BACI|nr:NAD(P)H:quinone oxidoreductase [Gracilibacillus orientalis]SFM14264.1 NAD(P)H dehydrogenase (quinone) [Gracilibacillus orientalis]